jgi:diphthamide biosynthesis protein 7
MAQLSMSFLTPIHCCSIEKNPTSLCNKYEFACGMYELNEAIQERQGAILLCNLQKEISSLHPVPAGVLDMKWNSNLLACALADGSIHVCSYDGSEILSPLINETIEDAGLALSIDWNCDIEVMKYEDTKIAVSTQCGSIYVYQFTTSGLEITETISSGHIMFGENSPVWIVAYNKLNTNLLMSGGDDCKMCFWDIRTLSQPIHKSNKNQYDAGVTSGQWSKNNEHVIATGYIQMNEIITMLELTYISFYVDRKL